MKKSKMFLCFLLVLTMFGTLLASCSEVVDDDEPDDGVFSPSGGIDENGFWKNVKALDCVELFDYKSMSIPRDIHQISDENVQASINELLADYPECSEEVMNRAVADGDTVNIDYVGSVDGIEFSGGSTEGGGTDVIAGSTNYIDDFLTQIIGHMPGDTINVEVTFPDVYQQNPDLAGKDAVFVTTINYIVEIKLTDDFVKENLSTEYGWKTVSEVEEYTVAGLRKKSIQSYIGEHMINETTILSMPDKLIKYQEKSLLNDYQEYADNYGIELEEVLSTYEDITTVEALFEKYRAENLDNATYALVSQAIAEDAGISVNDKDLVNYFTENFDTSDYSAYEEHYGLPFLKQVVLYQKVLDYIADNATLA